MGRSISEYSKFFKSFFLLSLGANTKPSADVNSVNMTNEWRGAPSPPFECFAMIKRKAASVTSAMGAKASIGFFNSSQKFFTLFQYFGLGANFYSGIRYEAGIYFKHKFGGILGNKILRIGNRIGRRLSFFLYIHNSQILVKP